MLRAMSVCLLGITSLLPVGAAPFEGMSVQPAVYHPARENQASVTPAAYRRHRRNHRTRRTVKRVGVGAAGGAAIGALAGGGKGAAIGAVAGGGAGALYDQHERRKGN